MLFLFANPQIYIERELTICAHLLHASLVVSDGNDKQPYHHSDDDDVSRNPGIPPFVLHIPEVENYIIRHVNVVRLLAETSIIVLIISNIGNR